MKFEKAFVENFKMPTEFCWKTRKIKEKTWKTWKTQS